MDFAPYQDTAPEQERALSPPPFPPPRRSSSVSPVPTRAKTAAAPPHRSAFDPPSGSLEHDHRGSDGWEEDRWGGGGGGGGGAGGRGGQLSTVNLFETSLPLRLDYEAMLAYLVLPPAGGVVLLLLEHRSDYVRYV